MGKTGTLARLGPTHVEGHNGLVRNNVPGHFHKGPTALDGLNVQGNDPRVGTGPKYSKQSTISIFASFPTLNAVLKPRLYLER
jgi:hypothetical protein